MAKSRLAFTYHPFKYTKKDPLAKEHQVLSQWVAKAVDGATFFEMPNVKFEKTSAGKTMLASKYENANRFMHAALAQLEYWDAKLLEIYKSTTSQNQRMNLVLQRGWIDAAIPRSVVLGAIASILNNRGAVGETELIRLCGAFNRLAVTDYIQFPTSSVGRFIEKFSRDHPPSSAFRKDLKSYVKNLRKFKNKAMARSATAIELIAEAGVKSPVPTQSIRSKPLKMVASGDPQILVQLKQYLGLLKSDQVSSTTILPDRFELRSDSKLVTEHELLTQLITETGPYHYKDNRATMLKSERTVSALKGNDAGRFMLAAAERRVSSVLFKNNNLDNDNGWHSRYVSGEIVEKRAKTQFTLDRDEWFDYLLFKATASEVKIDTDEVLKQAEKFVAKSPLTGGERFTLAILRNSLISGSLLGQLPVEVRQLNELIEDDAIFVLVPDEHWSVRVNADIGAMSSDGQANWIKLLKHWLTSTSSRPSPKWNAQSQSIIKEIGAARVERSILQWLGDMPRGRFIRAVPTHTDDTRTGGGDQIHDENSNAMRGMLWSLASISTDPAESARVVANVALSAYKKIPGVGPRAVKVGNACIYALSQIKSVEAVGQLAMLKVRVKFGTAQKEIEKAFNAAAEALGLPRDQIEELGVPTYGLEEVGIRRESFGDSTAELRVNGRDVSIHWTSSGKPVKSVPAKVKAEFKEELKELQGAAKDIAAMLPAQSERLDSLFLLDKSWPASIWRERYLDHPLIGTLARRLIWTSGEKSFAWSDGALIDVNDKPVRLPDDAQIKLWHPINRNVDEITRWREWLQRHEVIQPFKQAHREIYLLTDAERRTETYSNRFASHILRQHQFNALCAARFWRNKLRLMVDDVFPPATRLLPQFGLVAEFWIDGIGDDYGRDTTESGAYLRVSTDQVRFYRAENLDQPLDLEQIPPLVLSEIFRDVDLFVGVASVGNDPTWQDGGPDGRHRNYWQEYSFGILGESAKIRKSVLETLMPRLTKLKDKWELTDKFLIIQGHIRKYKIHLGSGNILMEPNDQYLCIVADRSAKSTGVNDVFLPFEGDSMLSIILSKAFLLADDKSINDTTITVQIRR